MPEPTSSPTPSILNQLFKAAGIIRVVFVDDRFGITPDRIQADANELSIEDLQKSGAFAGVDFSSDNEDIRRGLIEKAIGIANPPDLELMFDKMAAIRYEYGDSERDQSARTYFNRIVGEAAETLYFSLKQWEKHKDTLLAEAMEKPTLFIFDEDFSLEGQSKTHGRRLIGETHTVNTGYKFVYALLTHNAQNDDQELSLQNDIAKDEPALAEYLLVIAKSRLSDNGDRFAERMKQLLLYRLFQLLKRKLTHETAQASTLAVSEIEKLGIESFERIILGTSRFEGAWSPETLVRVIGVYQQQHIRQNIRKDAELHLAVREIDPICEVQTTKTDSVTTQAQRLQQDEIYEPGEKINGVHVPIAAGDIFKDAQGQQYILLAQPCDLMVRSDGLRRKERDPRQMAPMALVSKVSSEYKKQGLPSDQYELPHFVPKERWSVKLNEIYQLPIWLLDMAVLNEDGKCSLRDDQTATSLLISPWRTRLPILLDRAKAIVSVASKVVDESIDKSALVHSCSRIPLGSPFEVEITQSTAVPPTWVFALKLTRTSRVAELHSTGVLIDYAAYMARLAHPHDLARV